MNIESLNLSANTFEQANYLYRQVSERLLEQLDVIKLSPKRILDLGCGTGESSFELATRFPNAQIVGVDIAEQRIALAEQQYPNIEFICGDVAQLEQDSFDLVFSNLMLHWVPLSASFLTTVEKLLKVDGLFLFSFYGPDTFRSLGNVHAHLVDMHDFGDALVKNQFNNPILARETFLIEYDDKAQLLDDLTANGEAALVDVEAETIEEVTYEVITGHTWKLAEPMTSKMDEDGMVRISPAQILRSSL